MECVNSLIPATRRTQCCWAVVAFNVSYCLKKSETKIKDRGKLNRENVAELLSLLMSHIAGRNLRQKWKTKENSIETMLLSCCCFQCLILLEEIWDRHERQERNIRHNVAEPSGYGLWSLILLEETWDKMRQKKKSIETMLLYHCCFQGVILLEEI